MKEYEEVEEESEEDGEYSRGESLMSSLKRGVQLKKVKGADTRRDQLSVSGM